MSESKFKLQHLNIDYESSLSSPLPRTYSVGQGDIQFGNYGMQCVRCKTFEPLTPCSKQVARCFLTL